MKLNVILLLLFQVLIVIVKNSFENCDFFVIGKFSVLFDDVFNNYFGI